MLLINFLLVSKLKEIK